jgi:hypothetical protein
MKTTNLLPKLLVSAAVLSFSLLSSCKKETTTTRDEEFSGEAQNIAQSEDLSNSIDNTVAESFQSNPSVERTSSDGGNEISSCATVVRDSSTSTITITFNHCMGPNGHVRDGQIIVQYTGGGYWDVGASWDVSFVDFYVDDFHVTGTRHVENVGPASNGMKWNIDANLTFTRGDGSYRTWTSTRTRELTAGYGDSIRVNDIYVVNGTASHSDSQSGHSANITITNVTRDLSCAWITKGTITCTPTDGRPIRVIDFGDGSCDDLATVTKNGITNIIHMHP